MARLIRRVVVAAVAAGCVLPATGCGSKSESQPNPDLKVPDVPPGRKAGEGGPEKK